MRTFKGITNKQLEERENAGDKVTKASSFAFDWLGGSASFSDQSQKF